MEPGKEDARRGSLGAFIRTALDWLSWRRAAWLSCVLALAILACVVRVRAYSTKSCTQHDEIIALMSASCHQGDYEHARFDLSNRWVPARRWKALLTTDRLACFGTIRDDLVQYDIHPPLYFWLMHLCGVFTSFDATTGARLNTLIHVIGLLELVALTFALTRSRFASIAAATLWSFSIVALETTFVARQYELLGCLGVLAVLAMHRVLSAPSHARLWAVALACALAGMTLTHWFGLVGLLLVGGVNFCMAAIDVFRRHAGRTPPMAATRFRELSYAWLGGIALAFALHPQIVRHYFDASEGLPGTGVAGRPLRARMTLWILGQYFGFEHGDLPWASYFVKGALLVATVGVPCWQLARAVRARGSESWSRELADAAALAAIPCFAAVVTIPFVLGSGPPHAMSPRYLSLLWPLWGLGLVWPVVGVLRSTSSRSVRVIGLILGGAAFVVYPIRHGNAVKDEAPSLCGGESGASQSISFVRTVVTDNTHRGTWGPYIRFARDDAQIFAFPPPEGAVPDRPAPPSLDEGSLGRRLAAADAVFMFHYPNYGVTDESADEMHRIVAAAGLEPPDAGSGAWLLALEHFMVLVAYQPSAPGNVPRDVVEQLRLRGSVLLRTDTVDNYAAVLIDGEVQREVQATSAAVNLSSRELSAHTDAFSIVSRRGGAAVTIAGFRYQAPSSGFLIVVYDPTSHEVVRAVLAQPVKAQPRVWWDIAARLKPR